MIMELLEYLISWILTLGDNNITGGSTQYFDIHGSLQKYIVFHHGNIQIGNYAKYYMELQNGETVQNINFNVKKKNLIFSCMKILCPFKFMSLLGLQKRFGFATDEYIWIWWQSLQLYDTSFLLSLNNVS